MRIWAYTSSVFICLLLPISLLAADEATTLDTSTTSKTQESSYLLTEPLDIHSILSFPAYVFSLSTTTEGTKPERVNIDYSPPPATELSLGFSYQDFAFSWSRPIPQSSSNRNTYGEANYNDWRFEYGISRFALSVFHQRYKNFYTDANGKSDKYVRTEFGDDILEDKPTLKNSTYTPSEIIKRPDIRTQHSAAIFYYAHPILSDYPDAFMLSFRANAENTSEGFDLNWVSNFSVNHSKVESTYSLIPKNQTQKFKDAQDLIGSEAYSLGIATGLASSYVFSNSNFYLHGALLIGTTAQRQKTIYIQNQNWKNTIATVTHFRTGLVREGKTHSFSLGMIVDNWSYKINAIRFNSSNLGLELGYSIRL
ncbi:MAG: hypothetical protein M9962_06265 [Oligoflexia bacterium]|nr:hypothetical protein [Oligoflexia bacterium]